jgi:cyanophycin synthetase
MEHQAAGDVFRLLFLEGELLDVVRQVSPTLDGDGRSTIDALIRAENRRRVTARGEAGVAALRVDLDCLITLSRSGLGLDSVLAAGERRTIKTVTNEGRLEDCRTARDVLCDAIVEEARRAVRAVGLRVAGVDLITADPSRPLRETGGVVAEVNSIPALHRHYQVADAERAMPVAEPILARLLER